MADEIYRSCASIALLRQANGSFEVLLVHKPRKKDAWQLPQGGVEEGESIEQAAARELQEEAGVSAQPMGRSTVQYQYDFPASYRRFRPDNVKGQCISFVYALAQPDTVVAVDQHEIDQYVWVREQDLGRYIKRPEYREIVSQLVAEGIAAVAAS